MYFLKQQYSRAGIAAARSSSPRLGIMQRMRALILPAVDFSWVRMNEADGIANHLRLTTKGTHRSLMRFVVLPVAFLCLSSAANAVDPNRRTSQYGHSAWRIQDGTAAPGSTMTQTTDGYLWLGTSDGLAISRSIIESHSGHLGATRNSGPGSTFHFTLPTASNAKRVPSIAGIEGEGAPA